MRSSERGKTIKKVLMILGVLLGIGGIVMLALIGVINLIILAPIGIVMFLTGVALLSTLLS